MADTFGSLVEKAAYGVVYTSHQVPISLACLALAAAGLVVSWARSPGRRSDFAGPLVLLALIVLIAIIVSAQHAILGTPWLTGRTALFLLPLISTFVVVASDAMSRSGARIHAIVATVMALLAFAAAGHTVRVANVASTLDWPDDAATPAMLQEVESRVDRTTPQTVRVGVQWMFYPAARYYAERMSDATTRYVIEVAPVEGPPPDFVYTAERLDPDTATLIGGFTGSPATLWRTIPGAAAR